MVIKTASWFTKLATDHQQIGISRGVPGGMAAGYKKFPALNPGPWFNSSTIPQYLERYGTILAGLDPQKVMEDLAKLGGDKVPVLLCWETPRDVGAGKTWCHRHLAGQWLEDKLGISVEEVDHPLLDRWAKLRQAGIAPPSYR